MNDEFGNFIAGYVTGEGSFFVTFSSKGKLKPQVVCGFSIKVRDDDEELIREIWAVLGYSGNVHLLKSDRYRYKRDTIKRNNFVLLIVRSIDDITERVIPFFDKYPLRGQKLKNYELWKSVVSMMVKGEHLSCDGIEKIDSIRKSMNKYESTSDTGVSL